MNQRFEMIPCSSGELPEKNGKYPTDLGKLQFYTDLGWRHPSVGAGSYAPKWWLKPIPTPEPIPEGEGVTCQKCGNRYRVDLMVPDALWNQIKPEGKENGAGLLCGHCIISAMEAQGYGHLNCREEALTRMTPQEAKDEVAKRYGYSSWGELQACGQQIGENIFDEVMELYASGSSPVQGEATSWVEILNEFAFNFTEEQKLDYIKGASRYAKCAQLFMTTNREAYGRDRWKAGAEAMRSAIEHEWMGVTDDQGFLAALKVSSPDFQP